MRKVLTHDSVDHIKRLRKTNQGCFVRVDGDRCWTYNDCLLVRKKDTSEALFFIVTAAREKIAIQRGDMFVYGDTKETAYVNTPTDVVTYPVDG